MNRAHVDPLHSKNNSCQQLFQLILEESIGKSSISANVTTFNAVPVKSAFFKLVFALKEQAKMGRLVKRSRNGLMTIMNQKVFATDSQDWNLDYF